MPRRERSFLLLLLCTLLTGCGKGALHVHARAAMVTGSVLGQAGTLIVQARREALDGVVESTEGQTREERLSALEDTERAWQPAIVAHESTRLALLAWIDAISLADAVDSEDDVMVHVVETVSRLLLAWDPLAVAVQELGVDVPTLPDALRDLAYAVAEDRDGD